MFLRSKTDSKSILAPPHNGEYIVYGWKQSYFTRKLEAALKFYGTNFESRRINEDSSKEIRYRSGTHQIPVLHTSENWMLADTTPIIMFLDGRFPERRLFPAGALGVLVHILEDYFDEWIARTSVHWRWAYRENHKLLSLDATGGDLEEAQRLVDWGGRVCRATGVSTEIQQREAENEYLRILDAAEAQLGGSKFLLGERPTALDCIVLGGLRAHFNFDPAPKKVITPLYPIAIDWCEHRADTWDGSGNLAEFPTSTEFAQCILKEITKTYKPFLLANRDALEGNQKAFKVTIYGEDVSYLTRPYIEQSRQMTKNHIKHLIPEDDRLLVLSWLDQHGLTDVYA